MITRLTGILESIDGNAAVVAPEGSGLAYEVMLSAATSQALAPRVGHVVTLHTIQTIEQQAQGATMTPRLMAFASIEERRFFQLFTTVKGIGGRKALRAMAVPIGELARHIAQRDAASLKRLPEIGARLAETIIAELHGKVDAFAVASPTADRMVEGAPSLSGAAEKAIAALVRLGESRVDAETLIRRAAKDVGESATADELVAAAFSHRT